jgi:hypothetical protein
MPMTTSSPVTTSSVDRFCAGIEGATLGTADVFCQDAVLDATVPNWHFVRHGARAVQDELSRWYTDAGRFETLRRAPLPDGELVEFDLTWVEAGVPHACRQAHVLVVRDGRIARDTVWCGGRWPAALLAEMEEAQRTADRASDVIGA